MKQTTTYTIPDHESETVEFTSFNITLEKLLSDDYVSSPRNLQIAKIFKEMGLIERYGSGIKRVRQLFLNHGLPEPTFKMIQDGFFVRMHVSTRVEEQVDKRGEEPHVGVNVGANDLLKIIINNPGINAKQLHAYFDVTDRTVERWIKQLREENKIEFRGATKTGGYWKLK